MSRRMNVLNPGSVIRKKERKWMSKERIPKWTIWPEVVAETIRGPDDRRAVRIRKQGLSVLCLVRDRLQIDYFL